MTFKSIAFCGHSIFEIIAISKYASVFYLLTIILPLLIVVVFYAYENDKT